MNETTKLTDTMFAWYMQWTPLTIQTKRQIKNNTVHLASKTPGYMIKKVYMWSPFIIELKFYLLHTTEIVHVVQSTGAV